jgi:hypothetical protein
MKSATLDLPPIADEQKKYRIKWPVFKAVSFSWCTTYDET